MTDSGSSEQKKTIQKLCSDGGLMVTFETIGTLHQCVLLEEIEEDQTDSGETVETTSESLQWKILEYGIPVIIANQNGVGFCLADIESGDKLCEFRITTASQYTEIDDHFHIFTEPSGCFGFSFADDAVGKKIFLLLKRVVPCVGVTPTDAEEDTEPSPKEAKVEEDGGDMVDGPFHRKKVKQRPEISEPKEFQHLSHVGLDTSIGLLTQAMCWTDTLKRRKTGSCNDVVNIPVISKDTEEVVPPPGPPPPPAPPPPTVVPPPAKIQLKKKSAATTTPSNKDLATSLAEELKKGVRLRPTHSDKFSYTSETSQKSFNSLQEELKGGVYLKTVKSNYSMTLPSRPPKRSQSAQLLFEIKTFRHKKLRHIPEKEKDTSPTSSIDEKSIEAVMKRGFASMAEKLSSLDITNVGKVDSNGEDNIDGIFSIAE